MLNSMDRIMQDIGCSNDPRVNLDKIRKKIEELDDENRKRFIEEYLSVISRNEELSAKAKFYAELVCSGLLRCSQSDDPAVFTQRDRIRIGETELYFDTYICWNSFRSFDPERIDIYRNGQRVFVIGGLLNSDILLEYYDSRNDQLFVCYRTVTIEEANAYEAALKQGQDYDYRMNVGVLIIEDPQNATVCHLFKDLLIV
jgi:hypothetical protein